MAPIFGMRAGDYTGDAVLDLLMVGNWYAPNRETGHADAFVGAVLKGEGDGTFTPMSAEESGFFIEGDAKGLAEVAVGDEASFLITTQNDDSIRAFAPNRPRRSTPVEPFERYAILTYAVVATQKVELYDGSTYLSQSSNRLYLPPGVEKVVIHGREATRRSLRMDEENT